MKGEFEIKEMKFYAHHGCFAEEKQIGNYFIVDFSASYDMTLPASSDRLEDAVNYQTIYNLISEQMQVSSDLLEHLAKRILDSIEKEFPELENISVAVAKLYPPIGGQVNSFRVKLTK